MLCGACQAEEDVFEVGFLGGYVDNAQPKALDHGEHFACIHAVFVVRNLNCALAKQFGLFKGFMRWRAGYIAVER